MDLSGEGVLASATDRSTRVSTPARRRPRRPDGPGRDAERRDLSSPRDDVVKRRAYLLVTGLLIALLAAQALVGGTARPVLGVGLLALFAGLGGRWLSLRAFEAALMVVVVGALFGFLATWRLAPGLLTASTTEIYNVMLWSGLVFPLSFLILGTRRGLHAAIGLYAVFLLLAVPPVAGGDVPLADLAVGSTPIILSLVTFFAAMITLLWVLASRLEALATARTTATLLAEMAATDPLTRLPNRRQLDGELDRLVAQARRHGVPLSVLVVDVDHFKSLNDEHGHLVGDRALQAFARRLAGAVRADDVVGRWGGDEFLVIAPHTDQRAAVRLAERCRTEMAPALLADVGDLTASFGVATLTGEDEAVDLLRRADAALYAAKHSGRDAVATTPLGSSTDR